MPKIIRPKGRVSIHDAGLILYEEPNTRGGCSPEWMAYEHRFNRVILGGVIKLMRTRGWHVGADDDIEKNYRCLRKGHRYCTHRSGLECSLRQSGRCLEIKFYQNVKRPKNPHPAGGYYEYNRLEGMPYLMRKRCELEMDMIAGWLVFNCEYDVKLEEPKCHAGMGGVDADTWLEHRAKDAHWHGYKRAIHSDRPVESYNSKCIDGIVQNGERVYFCWPGFHESRWGIGIAEHNINNMWWVKVGTHEVRNVASHHISHAVPPGGLRGRQIPEHRRKERLEKLMLKAAEERRYLDAERMRRALEGGLYR